MELVTVDLLVSDLLVLEKMDLLASDLLALERADLNLLEKAGLSQQGAS
jgi:hypothetical protein